MAKTLTRYVCRSCGYEVPKWLGRCPGCDEWGTLEELTVAVPASKGLSSSRNAERPLYAAVRDKHACKGRKDTVRNLEKGRGPEAREAAQGRVRDVVAELPRHGDQEGKHQRTPIDAKCQLAKRGRA